MQQIFGDAKIGEVGVAFLVQENVGRFDVPMDDSPAVGDGERPGDLVQQGSGLGQRPGTILQRLAQAAAAQPAHYQIGAVWLAPIVVEWDDVQMFQLGNQSGFALKAADEVGLVGELGQDHFDGHVAVEGGLVGAVHHAETTGSNLLAQLIAANSLLRLVGFSL